MKASVAHTEVEKKIRVFIYIYMLNFLLGEIGEKREKSRERRKKN